MNGLWRSVVTAALIGMVAVLSGGCPYKLPPPVPADKEPIARPEVVVPPEAVRPMTITAASGGTPAYAHRIAEVRDRYLLLSDAASIGSYTREVQRGVLRESLEEMDKEIARSGWSTYIDRSLPDLNKVGPYEREAYDPQDLRDWLTRRGRSYYATHYWWPYRTDGSVAATDQESLRPGWRSEASGELQGAGGGGGGGAPGLPGASGGGMGPGGMGPGGMGPGAMGGGPGGPTGMGMGARRGGPPS